MRGARYRIEVELSEKSGDRYRELWRKLGPTVRGDEPAALYIAATEALRDKFLRLMRKQYFPGIYAACLNDFVQNQCPLEWRNAQGRRFELNGLAGRNFKWTDAEGAIR